LIYIYATINLTSRASPSTAITHTCSLPQLDPYKATADYLDMAIQFGYVCMFSVIWPFCPFCALLNNFLEIRGDAFRLMYLRRRPVPRKAANIGHWGGVFQLEIIISIFVSTGIFVLVRWGARRERRGWDEGRCGIRSRG
jgi:hypothetical protein